MERISREEEYIEEIDIRDVLRTIWKWKYMIASVACLFVAVSGILSYFVIEPVYTTETQMKVKEPVIVTFSDSQMDILINQLLGENIMNIDNVCAKIISQDVLKEVINKLNISVDLAELETMIEVNSDSDKQLITIIVNSNDGELSAQIANTLRDEAIKQTKRVNADNKELIKKGLDKLLQQEDEKLQLALQNLNKHMLSSKSTAYQDILLSAKITNLEEYKQQIAEAEIEREQLNIGIQQLQIILADTPKIITETSFIEESAVGQIPNIESGNMTINTIKSSEVYNKVLIDYNNKVTSLAEIEVKIQMLKELLASQEREIIQEDTDLLEIQLAQQPLQSEVDIIQSNITWLNAKKAEVNNIIELNLDDNLITTISEAFPPANPIKPDIGLNLVIALILGLMISVFIAFLLELIKNEKFSMRDQ